MSPTSPFFLLDVLYGSIDHLSNTLTKSMGSAWSLKPAKWPNRTTLYDYIIPPYAAVFFFKLGFGKKVHKNCLTLNIYMNPNLSRLYLVDDPSLRPPKVSWYYNHVNRNPVVTSQHFTINMIKVRDIHYNENTFW